MYYEVVSQCTQSLQLVEGWLDKAVAFAEAKNVDPDSLLNGRLAPDMKPLVYQVQSACDYVKSAPPGCRGNGRPSTTTPRRRPTSCAPASARPSILRGASLKRSTRAPKAKRSASLGRQEKCSAARTTCCR